MIVPAVVSIITFSHNTLSVSVVEIFLTVKLVLVIKHGSEEGAVFAPVTTKDCEYPICTNKLAKINIPIFLTDINNFLAKIIKLT